ncbi:NB-ARC domain-containing protein [Streptomyces sp. NBC_00536]|uniref:ATP-binding protein n=1 Tax=Streptomyces sp. NBC_00536 TaxID=2975769 RepID=UPI002E8095E1|nr:NB-ARC domain-containing protein [Streptomyces sp. NBC_00536]WUC83418.1 NB-ARC domain-containing protein [Streptomyces sp. NBC_00536]
MLAIIRVVNPTAARWLVGLASTVGAFAAAAAGWQAFGEVGPAQYAFAGVTALVGGSLAWMQAGRPPQAPELPHHPVPRELPRDIADFTGRSEELVRIQALLGPPDRVTGPLVAIAGKGGLGKTTLAVRAAQRSASEFPDGQLFANLRGYDPLPADPNEVLATFLRSLGADPRTIPDAGPDREQMLRTLTAGRRLLIVLDNANGPGQVRPLLPGASDVAVIVTSRSPLSTLEGAQTIVLDLLEPEEAIELLGRVAGADRVAGDPAAALRLVALCGHLPLSVRIAGARLAERPDIPVADLADRLADERERLDHLEIGDLDVRSTFMISYRGLPEAEQRAFRLLGLFPGADFAAWPLAALMDVSLRVAERHIGALVSAQMLDAIGPDETGTARYRFHDLLRALAREQPEPESATATGRLLGAYLTLAATAEDRFQPGEVRKISTHPRHEVDDVHLDALLRDPVTWFITEQHNVVACVRLANAREFWDASWELTHIGAPFFEMLATWDDWGTAVELALDAARRSNNRWAEAITRFDTGALRRDLGRLDDAMVLYGEALTGYEASGDQHGTGAVMLLQGIIHRNRRDWEPAAERLIEAAEHLRNAGDRRLTAQALRSLAVVRGGQRRVGEAIPLFQEALAEFQNLGDRRAEAYAWRGLAQAELDNGDTDAAGRSFGRSLDMTRQLRDRRGEGRALQGLGRVSAESGATAVALRRFAQARGIAEEIHDEVLTRELDRDVAAANRR